MELFLWNLFSAFSAVQNVGSDCWHSFMSLWWLLILACDCVGFWNVLFKYFHVYHFFWYLILWGHLELKFLNWTCCQCFLEAEPQHSVKVTVLCLWVYFCCINFRVAVVCVYTMCESSFPSYHVAVACVCAMCESCFILFPSTTPVWWRKIFSFTCVLIFLVSVILVTHSSDAILIGSS